MHWEESSGWKVGKAGVPSGREEVAGSEMTRGQAENE